MRGSNFIFNSVDALWYDLNKISLNRGGSYIDSSEWLKSKKVTISPKNNDYKFFQYAVTVALNHGKLKITQKEYQILSLLLINIIGKK